MTSASREWKSLTQIQRDSWATYADAHPVPDWTGSMIRLTGMNAYIRLNMQSRQAGGVQIMTPPAAAAPAVPAALTAAINATNLQATWTGALPAAVKLDVWLVGPVSTGANPRREKAVHKVFSAAAGDTPLQIIAACPAGRYGVWMRTVDTATGLTSAETKVVVDVV
jgi:hypothetical protein